ncbi:hypothetical protein KY362_01620 [Candidatus Woesearchaeota archaeon]|nr:hypothetical protein [Candidatus Woesearchaeota archaeon]
MARIQDYDLQLLHDKPELCKSCLNWKDFKEKCWYFWEHKRECSQKIKI